MDRSGEEARSETISQSDTMSRSDARDEHDTEPRMLERFVPELAGPVRVTCFWTAIALPFLHVPLLATGLTTASETIVFLLLVGLNVLALYVGHSHRQDGGS